MKMDAKLESKSRRFVRMIFQDIFANLHSKPEVWKSTPQQSVGGWPIPLGESNGGTLQLVCVGIETCGRALLGYKNQGGKSEESFTAFLTHYFPATYQGSTKALYVCYRCGLLHSHYLGFGTDSGFYPTRRGRLLSDKHLQFTDLAGQVASATKTAHSNRLIINIDTFTADFKASVENYLADLNSGAPKTHSGKPMDLVKNLKQSLEDLPEEDQDLLKQRLPEDAGKLTFGDVTVTATQTSYPLPSGRGQGGV